MTIKQAQSFLRSRGISLRRLSATDEYRVNFMSGAEATACYTNDLDDAVGTGKAMAEWRVMDKALLDAVQHPATRCVSWLDNRPARQVK